MSDGDVQEPQQTADEPRGRSRRFAAVMVAIVVCVVAIILLIPVAATSSSSYCGSCHSMKQAYRSWQRGAHSAVPCSECHIPPGTVAAVKWRTTEARNIWLTYLNMKPARDTQPRPASENCEKCHPLKGLMGIPGKIRMPHARHINQNNLECIDCHDHTAHAAPGREQRGQHGPLHHVPRADHRHQPLRLLSLHATGHRQVASHRLHRRSTAVSPSPTSVTACAVTTTRRTSATAATRSPRRATTRATGRTRTAKRPRRTATAASAATPRSSCATSVTPWTTRPTGRRRTRRWPPRACGRASSVTPRRCATTATPRRESARR